MQFNELRIGNIINVTHQGKPMPAAVWSISRREIYANTLEPVDVKYMHKRMDQVEGVPLMEDWLVRLGFECDDNDRVWTHKCTWGGLSQALMMVERINDPYSPFMVSVAWQGVIEIKVVTSVHQLQNLYFAITGEELKLKS